MFEAIVERADGRPKRLGKILAASVGAHGVVLAAVLVAGELRVAAVPEPSVIVTFVDFSAAPPPPPPPPPKKRAAPKKVEPTPEAPKPEAPTEVVAPAQIPEQEAPETQEDTGDDEGSDTGSENGVDGGVEGGVEGGVGTALPPAPPAGPVFQDVEWVKQQRLEGSEPKYPPPALHNRIEGVVVAKIVIGIDGRVTDIELVQTHPAFERAVRAAIEGWVFKPHLVDGRPVPIYTIYRFVFKTR